MKLLITTQVLDRNDSNLGFFHGWVEEFAKQCEQVIVICLRKGEYSLPANVKVLSLGKEEGVSRPLRAVRALRYVIRKRKDYDAVFVHMNPEYVLLAGLFWRLWGKKVVLWYVHKSVTLKLRIAALLVHRIATASAESLRLHTKKMTVLGHGINTALFRPEARKAPSVPPHIATVGRISESKHIRGMFEALDVLYAEGYAFRFSIAGLPITASDREYEHALKKELQKRPYGGDAVFVGAIPYAKLSDFFAGVDLFINLSSTGSVDKAVLEALAAGVPVVTSNEAFKNGELPVTYTEPNAKEIAAAIERTLAHPPQADILARPVEEMHSLSRTIKKILSLYV